MDISWPPLVSLCGVGTTFAMAVLVLGCWGWQATTGCSCTTGKLLEIVFQTPAHDWGLYGVYGNQLKAFRSLFSHRCSVNLCHDHRRKKKMFRLKRTLAAGAVTVRTVILGRNI